jgi:hypothetical protein
LLSKFFLWWEQLYFSWNLILQFSKHNEKETTYHGYSCRQGAEFLSRKQGQKEWFGMSSPFLLLNKGLFSVGLYINGCAISSLQGCHWYYRDKWKICTHLLPISNSHLPTRMVVIKM